MWVGGKLMWFNRPQAKIHFKSDSNHLLIDFFDPISAVWSTGSDDLIWILTIYIKNKSNSINFFNINQLFWSFNRLFRSFNWLFQTLDWSLNCNISNLYWNRGHRLKFVVRFWIGPKSTNDFARLEIRIIDNSILEA